MSKLNSAIGPRKLCCLIYWYSERILLEQIMEYTGLKRRTVSTACYYFSALLAKRMFSLNEDVLLGDDPDTVVMIDVTHLTKKKRQSHIAGRETKGTQIKVLDF